VFLFGSDLVSDICYLSWRSLCRHEWDNYGLLRGQDIEGSVSFRHLLEGGQ